MKILRIGAGALLVSLSVSQANAAAPNSITTLLGPSVGYLLAQSDLCGWNLNDRIHTAFQNGFQQIGMTDAQQAAAWQEAKARETKLTTLPAKAITRMKADICTSAMRAQIERQLTE